MRTFAICLLSFALCVGCTNRPKPHGQFVPHKTENSWTSDALERGDVAAVQERVLDDPTYLLEQDDVGDTPLLSAITFDNLGLVQFLLAHGADPNVTVDHGYTCLLTAIEFDADESTRIVAELIRAGANIHTTGAHGWTPLHMAAARGHVEKARLLIDAGADVNHRKEIDALETPLMEAAYTGQPSTVRLLLANGADPSMRDAVSNRTPLEISEYTARGPDPDVVNYLESVSTQIDVDALFRDRDLPADRLEWLKQTMKYVDMKRSYIDSSNEIAKTGNHAEVIRILSEHRR